MDSLPIDHAYLESPHAHTSAIKRSLELSELPFRQGRRAARSRKSILLMRGRGLCHMCMCPRLTFSRLINNTLPSSSSQEDSSTLTSCGKSPSRIGGWPLSPQRKCFFVIDTITSFGLAGRLTFSGTLIYNIKIATCIYLLARANIVHKWRLENSSGQISLGIYPLYYTRRI